MTTMLFSFEGGDVKSLITGNMQESRRNIALDKFSRVLRGSANDNLAAETR